MPLEPPFGVETKHLTLSDTHLLPTHPCNPRLLWHKRKISEMWKSYYPESPQFLPHNRNESGVENERGITIHEPAFFDKAAIEAF